MKSVAPFVAASMPSLATFHVGIEKAEEIRGGWIAIASP